MEVNKLDPRSKMLLFLSACVTVMNVHDSFFTLVFVTLIMIIGIYLGQFKVLRYKYLFLVGALAIEQLLFLLEQSASVMFLLIVIVCMKLYMPMLMSFKIVHKTTTISEFIAAFTKMKVPLAIIIPFAVMFRFIPTVKEEWDGVRQAMGFRGIGLRFKRVIRHPLLTVEYIIVPLLFSCINVIDELVAASLARGLESSKKRTCLVQVKLKAQDYICIITTLGLVVYGFTI